MKRNSLPFLSSLKSAVYRLLRLDRLIAHVESIHQHLCSLSAAHHGTAGRVSALEDKLAQLEKRIERRVHAIGELLGEQERALSSGNTPAYSVSKFIQLAGQTSPTTPANCNSNDALLFELPDGARVLELGVSTLYLASRLLESGAHYQGLTFSPLLVELARQTFAASKVGDASVVEFSDESLGKLAQLQFDLIFVSVSAANWSTRRAEWLMALASSVLAPGGKLFLSLPLSFTDQSELGWHSVSLCREIGLEATELDFRKEGSPANLVAEWQQQLGSKSALTASRACELS